MPYTLKTTQSEFRGGKNILASEHFQFIEGGATLDAAAIGARTLPVGTPIMRSTTTGKFVEYADASGAVPAGYDELSILNIDVVVDGTNDVIVGEVLVKASVYDAKLPATVTAAFRAATDYKFRYVRHIG